MTPESPEADAPDWIGLLTGCVIVVVFVVLRMLGGESASLPIALSYLTVEVALISVIIWQVCDPFADAAQWIGATFRLPSSVRGATLDAVASSMPELFSGIFFVVVAISTVSESDQSTAARLAAGAEGFGATIATCAGSAVYNMILIPAFCALVISYTRKERPTIDVDDEVISRDGVWFVCCQVLLILFLFQDSMTWWMAVVFLALYGIYVWQLYSDAARYRRVMPFLKQRFESIGADESVAAVSLALKQQNLKASASLIARAQAEFTENGLVTEGDGVPEDNSAKLFFGMFSIPLNRASVWGILAASTLLAAVACYFLVEATISTARVLGISAFFVAVILAAAASSVPDTFLAIAAARRGDDSGAVSNAFGSNIFDICICLSIPLLVNCYLTGWAPVSLLQDGRPMAGLMGLRILLVVLTITNLAIMWHNRQITRFKAFVMCGLYLLFIAYAVLESQGLLFTA